MTHPGSSSNGQQVLRFGVIGVGNAGGGVLHMMREEPNVEVVAAADVRPEALKAFRRDFGGKAYDSVEGICRDPDLDVVWIATPNHFHCPHTVLAAEHGKHVVLEKPMALSLGEASLMVETAEKHGVKLLSGHTRAFDPPVQTMWRIIRSGEVGAIKAMNVMSFTDWMLRPRMPEEVDVERGGGVAFRQAPHQIDSLRFLGGGLIRSVRGTTGIWMEGRQGAPGYYSAYLEFEDGTPATIVYNAYGYFLASELLPWEMEAGAQAGDRARMRMGINTGTWDQSQAKDEMRVASMRGQRIDGVVDSGPPRMRFQSDLGLLLVTCERGLLRQSPNGIYVYNDDGLREEPINVRKGGDPTIEEAYNGIVRGTPIFHDGRWGMATLEVQLALMQSARERREVLMEHQVPVPADIAH
ncbi:MAG: Gfo/Idh/MocA family oxidoreductase [Chloroflexota bacterium]|nr:Gfo/Idh/MocA family oxidoreductase [Chloroflexota bacterium]